MEHLIDKDVLVAELKKRIKDYWSDSENTMGIYPYTLEEVIKYINSLEAKEVDLEKEIKDYLYNQPIVTRCKGIDYKLVPSAEKIAKHFFELGLAASNPLTWEDIACINNIVSIILAECEDKILYDTDESFCKEVLRRFKIKKGG